MFFEIWLNVVLVVLLSIASSGVSSKNKNHHLVKRTLLFPQYTVLQFTYGVTAPAMLPNQTVFLSICLQQNYEPPNNFSQFFPTVVSARESNNDLDKTTFYKYIIGFLDGFGLNGESCLLRAVCEIADVPMHIESSENVLESIIHYLLTPSVEAKLDNVIEELYPNNTDLYTKLLLAEYSGKSKGKCSSTFSNCGVSLVNLFTKIFYA